MNRPTNIRAVFFDMDGVLYDSMKHHVETWVVAFKKFGIDFPERASYMNEGRTGDDTIQKVIREVSGREATLQETEAIYAEKTRLMNKMPPAAMIPGMQALMQEICNKNIRVIVVTGSKQPALLNRLKNDYGVEKEDLVTGWDVNRCKPDPEPYEKALHKAGCSPSEAVVIENAPLGVEAAVQAGIFTIAINTGPLPDEILHESGAGTVVKTADEIRNFLKAI
ncbi:HAD family hydrolase [Thermophagus sp. OGC60D27]|uniref:HAD family hydrolase n=1 Tax=Thermophagus sp. OGC60D27 TaxID=3458415 RepID=UPI0040381D45